MHLQDRAKAPFDCRCRDEDRPAYSGSFSAFKRRCDPPGHVFRFRDSRETADKFTVGESSSKRCQKSVRESVILMAVFDAALTLVAL